MPRKFTITVEETLTDEQYADLANALWMMLRNTPWHFAVTPDGRTSASKLNAAWDQYGRDAGWR